MRAHHCFGFSALLLVGVVACNPPPDGVPADRIPPEWPPPAWCKVDSTVELELGCEGRDCVAGVMVDYYRLEPRGFIVRSLTGQGPISAQQAEAIAQGHVTEVLGAPAPDQVDSDRAGDFYNCFLLYQSHKGSYQPKDSWLVVVHAGSGQVVFAGLEIWANPRRGESEPDPALPPGWQGPDALGCTDGAPAPQSKALRTTGRPVGSEPASTVRDAWDKVGRRLNLTEQFSAGAAYRVMVISFSTATGEFDPWAADWLVWLTRGP